MHIINFLTIKFSLFDWISTDVNMFMSLLVTKQQNHKQMSLFYQFSAAHPALNNMDAICSEMYDSHSLWFKCNFVFIVPVEKLYSLYRHHPMNTPGLTLLTFLEKQIALFIILCSMMVMSSGQFCQSKEALHRILQIVTDS